MGLGHRHFDASGTQSKTHVVVSAYPLFVTGEDVASLGGGSPIGVRWKVFGKRHDLAKSQGEAAG